MGPWQRATASYTDAVSSGKSAAAAVVVAAANAVPSFTSAATYNAAENQTTVGTHTVPGAIALSVADASAREGPGATIDFQVTLSRAASGKVTVRDATKNGTAKKGKDYCNANGKLVFAPGETSKTVSVELLDDAHDEGEETFTLRLSKPKGAVIADGKAVGTITNPDPLQQDWLARFGRAAAARAERLDRRRAPAREEVAENVGAQFGEAAQRREVRRQRAMAGTTARRARKVKPQRHEPGVGVAHEREREVAGVMVHGPDHVRRPVRQGAAVPGRAETVAPSAMRQEPRQQRGAGALGHLDADAAVAVRDHRPRAPRLWGRVTSATCRATGTRLPRRRPAPGQTREVLTAPQRVHAAARRAPFRSQAHGPLGPTVLQVPSGEVKRIIEPASRRVSRTLGEPRRRFTGKP